MQLKQIVDGFFIVRRARLASTTQESYRQTLKRFVAYFGEDKLFANFTGDDIRHYMHYLSENGLSDRSVHDCLVILSSLWTFAAQEFGVPHIIKQVEKPSYTQKEIVPFTESEIKLLLAAAEWTMLWNTSKGKAVRSHRPTWRRDIAIILLLLDTGLRVSEMCKLLVSDYQQESGRLMVRYGKGNKQRVVFLGATAQRVLWRYMMGRQRIRPQDPIFTTRDSKPLDRGYVRQLVARIGDNAGVPSVHPHRFRHTFAIQFLRNGGNVFELQRILGHSELDTVKIYLSIAQVDIERAQKANSPADNWRL